MSSTDLKLICTDLDRTLLPNGDQEESSRARDLFRRLTEREDVRVAYVSGRRRGLQEEAIAEYGLPVPDLSVCDVGTTIYRVRGDEWVLEEQWRSRIARAWKSRSGADLAELLEGLSGMSLQEQEAQAEFKLSYYVDSETERESLLEEIRRRLESREIDADLIWSVDETTGTRLLDILPGNATKLNAVEYLIESENVARENVVYAGDSGNDLPVLTSGIRSVLVANATEEVRDEAKRGAKSDTLYFAGGGFMGMNGNYAAGILEGVARFIPELKIWMERL